MGDESSALSDSFQDGLLAPPIFTRPANYKGWEVPEILTSGNSPKIEEWRENEALKRTQTRNYKKSGNTDDFLESLSAESGERNQAYVKHLKKIIMVSIKTVDILQKLDTYKLDFTKTH